jgi:hypothetical protein
VLPSTKIRTTRYEIMSFQGTESDDEVYMRASYSKKLNGPQVCFVLLLEIATRMVPELQT